MNPHSIPASTKLVLKTSLRNESADHLSRRESCKEDVVDLLRSTPRNVLDLGVVLNDDVDALVARLSRAVAVTRLAPHQPCLRELPRIKGGRRGA